MAEFEAAVGIFDRALAFFRRIETVGRRSNLEGEIRINMRPARLGEEGEVVRLRSEAAGWIEKNAGVKQWAKPWPTEEALRSNIRSSIERGETWMAEDSKGRFLGTIALDKNTAGGLWTEREMSEP